MPDIRDVAPHVGILLAKIVRKAAAAKPGDRYQQAADFDAALGALQASAREIAPVFPHPGHDRCWTATRISGNHFVDLCVKHGGRAVEARHRASGNRLLAQCASPATDRALLIHLRKALDALRRA